MMRSARMLVPRSLAGPRKAGIEAWRFAKDVWRYRTNPVAAGVRCWRLYRQRHFSPEEIHSQGLLDPRLHAADLARAVSKEELLAVQLRLNPQAFHRRTEDKVFFDEFCAQAGLPVPRLLARYGGDKGGEAVVEGPLRVLRNEEDIAAFLGSCGCSSLILKPVAGVHGEGVLRLDLRDGQWCGLQGAAVDAAALMQWMAADGYVRWVFQARVEGHPALVDLSGTAALQTVRVVTLVDEQGAVRILAARLRLICGAGVSDNFDFGRSGNVVAILDPASGRVRSAVGGVKGVLGAVERHPVTGRVLVGFEVPGWAAVKDLVTDAALKFQPLRTIGWDVAVTADAPCLIEGNVTWDALIGDPAMGDVYRELKALAEK